MMNFDVQDVMTRAVVSISEDTTVDETCSLLLRHNVSGLPVVDADSRLVGVVSERDLLNLLYEPDKATDPVATLLTRKVVTLSPTDSVLRAADIFLANSFRRLPVVDDDGRLQGVVSRRDLIRFIRDVRLKVANALQRRRQGEGSFAKA